MTRQVTWNDTSATVRHYTYEASQHCRFHAEERFGIEALDNGTAEDSEGNAVGACFTWDECDDDTCDECVYEEISERWGPDSATQQLERGPR
jgi:hypothetical protein